MEERKMVFGIPVSEDDFLPSFNVIEKLRDDLPIDFIGQMALSENSLRSNLRRANKEKADIVLIFDKARFGDDIIIKDMVHHIQIIAKRNEVIDKIKELLSLTYPKELLMQYKAEQLPLDTAEFLLEMYYKKGYK